MNVMNCCTKLAKRLFEIESINSADTGSFSLQDGPDFC